jgi:hypothetical protein
MGQQFRRNILFYEKLSFRSTAKLHFAYSIKLWLDRLWVANILFPSYCILQPNDSTSGALSQPVKIAYYSIKVPL